MELKKEALFIIMLVVGFSLSSNFQLVHGNPYWVPDSATGSIWTNSTNVEMPYAEVLICIDYRGLSVYHIDFTGNFTIKTNETQQCTLAFAFPDSWDDNLIFDDGIAFDITLDETPVTTWPIYFENASWIQPWGTDVLYHMSCDPDFVGFNVSLQANVTHILQVESSFTLLTNYLELGYVCGTAVSFKGTTWERITMIVNETEPLEQVAFAPHYTEPSIEFPPSYGFMRTNISSSLTAAVWEIFFPPWDQIDFWIPDMVAATLENFEYDRATTPAPETTTTISPTSPPPTSPPPSTPQTTPTESLGRIALGGAFGFGICIAIFVLWESKKD